MRTTTVLEDMAVAPAIADPEVLRMPDEKGDLAKAYCFLDFDEVFSSKPSRASMRQSLKLRTLHCYKRRARGSCF